MSTSCPCLPLRLTEKAPEPRRICPQAPDGQQPQAWGGSVSTCTSINTAAPSEMSEAAELFWPWVLGATEGHGSKPSLGTWHWRVPDSMAAGPGGGRGTADPTVTSDRGPQEGLAGPPPLILKPGYQGWISSGHQGPGERRAAGSPLRGVVWPRSSVDTSQLLLGPSSSFSFIFILFPIYRLFLNFMCPCKCP